MSRILKPNSKIVLLSGDEEREFLIERKKGVGGSCVAYVVSFFEADGIRHKGILKEFCPAYLGEVLRTTDNSIIVPDSLREKFNKSVKDFKNSYKFINNYIAENEFATNYHPVQLGLFEGHNTVYSLSSYDYGKEYAAIKDDSLYSLIKIMISVTKAIEMYHNAGFIHCDIKPENIFILDDVTELIKLFDYDSLLNIDELKKGLVEFIPNPKIYYVPELEERNYRNVGIKTDIFEIGAMIYYRLFSKAPSINEMEHDAVFNFDESDLMNGVAPKIRYEVHKLLKNTLQISVRRRYKNAKELLSQLNLILSNLDSKKPYLLNLPVWQPTKLRIERTTDLLDIHTRLSKDGYVFIKGMGGLGKSELSKMYVKKFKNNYHTIQFCKYMDSLKSLVAMLPMSGINDEEYDSIDELFKVKNRILRQCDSNTLLIIDNFNVTHDKKLREFLPTDSNGFKVIFTTRCMPDADYYEDKVVSLSPLPMEECKSLFYLHNPIIKSPASDIEIEHLVKEIQHNTLLLVLIAKMLRRTSVDIKTVIQKLEEQELDSINTKVFYEYDYADEDIEVHNKINNHLNIVYSISGLGELEKKALMNMTLISSYGIEKNDFVEVCDDSAITKSILDELINQSWLESNEGLVSMHSIVSDVVAQQDVERQESYYLLANYLEDQCYVDEISHITVLQKALAIAKQLYKRYKLEDDEAQAGISYLLGTIYLSLFRPKDAESFLKKALLGFEAIGEYDSLSVVYNRLGDYEAKFGTGSKAICCYSEAIRISEQFCNYEDIDDPDCDEICGALLGIAECYERNNELEQALEYYKKLFDRLVEYDTEYTDSVIKDIVRLSEELGNQSDVDYYSSALAKYEVVSTNEKESFENSFSAQLNYGDLGKAHQEYESMLSELREILGEEAPLYKDIAKYRWVYYLMNNDEAEADRLIADNMDFIEHTYGKNSMEMADFLSVLSFQMIDNAKFEYGIELSQRAIKICESHNQDTSYVYTKAKMNLISANAALGDFHAAGEIAKKLDLYKYAGSEYLSDIIKSVGLVYLELGSYDEMVHLSHKIIENKNIDRLSKTIALELLLIYHERKGELEKAEYYLSKVKEQIDSLSTLEYAKSYLLIFYRFSARIFSRKKDNMAAVNSIDKAIDLYEDKSTYVLLSCYQDRGVYNTYLNRYDEADKDFKMCNEIVDKYSLLPKVNLLVFNNIALVHYKKGEYVEAGKYYDAIIEIHPNVIHPTNYNEAVICQNYGWMKYNLDESEIAEECLLSAIAFYESNGFEESVEYVTAKYNLSLVYSSQNRHEINLTLLFDLYQDFDKINESDVSVKTYIVSSIVLGLLISEKTKEAYEFALDEDKNFAKEYGKKSIERIDYLQKTAGVFKYCGYLDVFDFLEKSDKLIKKAHLEKSIFQASQLNYVGVTFLDLKDDPVSAIRYLTKSKELLEELGEQENSLYGLVCSNLDLAREKEMDKLIKAMVDSMSDEN